MSMVNGGELVGRALKNEGVEVAFVLCGLHIMPTFYGMRNAGIEIIDVRHECSALYAAIAYTQATGKIAAVVTTAGPGIAHTSAGMMEAESQYMPVVHIGGAVATNTRDTGDLQDTSTLTLMASCSKWARVITSTERIPEYVSMAFRHATDSNPGPVFLEMPYDLVAAQVEEESIHFPVNSRTQAIPSGDPALIEAAAELLAGAERPAMVFGDGARLTLGNDAGAVAELSDYLKMPISNIGGNICRGHFGDESENPLLNTDGLVGADVVLAIGCRFDFRTGYGKGIAKDAKVIQVHTDMRQIGFNVRADIGIVGGSGPVTRQILEEVRTRRDLKADDPWTGAPGPGGIASLDASHRDEKTPVHPARCAGDVAKFIEEEARDWNIVIDGGIAGGMMGRAATARHPSQIHGWGPNGTLGSGTGRVIGAWVANRKPVLFYTGDGSFGFYAMEMDTMARLGMPVVCVIHNDSAWGSISSLELILRADEVNEKGQCNTELANMRAYEKMAAVWGGYGEMVTDPNEIIPAIKRAAATGTPSIINVQVDAEILPPAYSALLADMKK